MERTRSGRRGPQAPQRLVIQNPHFSTTPDPSKAFPQEGVHREMVMIYRELAEEIANRRCFRRVLVPPKTYCVEAHEICQSTKSSLPSRHGGTLNSHRAASPLMWLVEGVERWEAPDHPQVSSLKIGMETNQIVPSPVWCSKLRLTTGVT
ncbi:hypothetical protein TNCV_123111 [Trichonephila clavipes]|nr:hypothetical protein TNCV_123111 [Trichonephila clavipes]